MTSQPDTSNNGDAGEWFQTPTLRFVYEGDGSLTIWSLKWDRPHRTIAHLPPIDATAFRDWLLEASKKFA